MTAPISTPQNHLFRVLRSRKLCRKLDATKLTFSSKFKFFRFAHMLNKDRLDVHTAHYDCNLQTDWNFAISLKHCRHDWETNKTLSTWCEVHGNLRPLATMDLHQARCANKVSPACEHRIPSSRPQLLITTIVETNMALWTFGRPGQLQWPIEGGGARAPPSGK